MRFYDVHERCRTTVEVRARDNEGGRAGRAFKKRRALLVKWGRFSKLAHGLASHTGMFLEECENGLGAFRGEEGNEVAGGIPYPKYASGDDAPVVRLGEKRECDQGGEQCKACLQGGFLVTDLSLNVEKNAVVCNRWKRFEGARELRAAPVAGDDRSAAR